MKILIIDDEPQIRIAVKAGLERNNYETILASSGTEGLNLAATYLPDIIILDIAMPGKDGFAVTRELRTWSKIPIIILSVRDDERDKIKALDLGADDYLVKPFSFEELYARVRALLRRPKNTVGTVIKLADLTLDPISFNVTRNNHPIELTSKEFTLLEYMMHHPNQVLTKDMIINHVWNEESNILVNTIEVYIGYLRNKIDRPFPKLPNLIQTKRGFGYLLKTE